MFKYDYQHAHKVRDLLETKKTEAVLENLHCYIYAAADVSDQEWNWDDGRFAAGQLHPADSNSFDWILGGEDEHIREVFEERVVQKLGRPAIIQAGDLTDEFARVMRVDDFTSAYRLFIGNIFKYILIPRTARPFAIGEIPERRPQDPTGKPEDSSEADTDHNGPLLIGEKIPPWCGEGEEPFWHGNGVRVELLPPGPPELSPEHLALPDAWNRSQVAFVRLSSVMAESCVRQLRADLLCVLTSVVRSVSLLTQKDTGVTMRTGLPKVSCDLLSESRPFIRSCLSHYFAEPTKKDTFRRRICNAVQLLSQADLQVDDAIGLSLSMAAIEALLGEKGPEIAKTLADRIAALLEPDLRKRANAVKLVKKLYNSRSRALHGEMIDGEALAREDTRLLAAGVLAVMVMYDVFRQRMGEDAAPPNTFFSDLDEAKFDSGLLAGISELQVRRLWKYRGKHT